MILNSVSAYVTDFDVLQKKKNREEFPKDGVDKSRSASELKSD